MKIPTKELTNEIQRGIIDAPKMKLIL